MWSAKVGRVGGGSGYPGPRATPTVDGDHVYALGQFGDLVCVTAADGKETDFSGWLGLVATIEALLAAPSDTPTLTEEAAA